MGRDTRRDLGTVGEKLAAEHLLRRGYRILERNYRTRWGELDLIAFDGATIAFCEVKTRHMRGPGPQALDSVGPRKRAQVRRMARAWLSQRTDRPYGRFLRFDAIGVTFDAGGHLIALDHLENAF